MEWTELYNADVKPSEAQISEFINNPLWDDLNRYLSENYQTGPKLSYSVCTWQPGWNVKYQKAGKALCTLYPMQGFFIAMVVVGDKEKAEAEALMPTFQEYTRNLYESSGALMGARWMMIHVDSAGILDDVKRLIQLRRKIKSKDG